jgi:hypothetical protein
MNNTITIKLRNKKVRSLLECLEDLKLIKIIEKEIIPKNWPAKKKQQARNFLAALKQAKLAEQGKIKLKTADELITEMDAISFPKNKSKRKLHSIKPLEK